MELSPESRWLLQKVVSIIENEATELAQAARSNGDASTAMAKLAAAIGTAFAEAIEMGRPQSPEEAPLKAQGNKRRGRPRAK